ncbi:hypothetical protein [Streptomyces pseudovenezuelae]|uniref:hypothetical protein n=1 Tax=Streptomyces pseudovenezuelae TaxID=67350 RepID=UPI001CED3FFB|nr:hypothetical protein [Streptomyces pseudovenezuelae]
MEEPEAELPGFGASVLEEADELTVPDGVKPPSAVSAPLPPGSHPATAKATEATTTAIAEPRIPFTCRMLSPESKLSGARLLAAPVEPDRTMEPPVLAHADL